MFFPSSFTFSFFLFFPPPFLFRVFLFFFSKNSCPQALNTILCTNRLAVANKFAAANFSVPEMSTICLEFAAAYYIRCREFPLINGGYVCCEFAAANFKFAAANLPCFRNASSTLGVLPTCSCFIQNLLPSSIYLKLQEMGLVTHHFHQTFKYVQDARVLSYRD